jgi:DNA polymerase I-like protein with 3'-5' exonuclease and polymerase domains
VTDFPNLSSCDEAGIDSETTGLSWVHDRIFGFSLSLPNGEDFYWDVRRTPQALDWAREEFPKIKQPIFFNEKFDKHFFLNEGIELNDTNAHDAAVAAALIDEHLDEYNLEFLAARYTTERKLTSIYQQLADIFGGKATKTQMKNLQHAPFELASVYAKADTRATFALRQAQKPLLAKEQLERVYAMEMQLTPVLFAMERRGARVNIAGTEKAIQDITEVIARRQQKLNYEAGSVVNANSSAQLIKLLDPRPHPSGRGFELPDGTFVPATKGGKPSMNKDVLMKTSLPMGKLIRGLKNAMKTRDTFLVGHILGHQVNGYVHANFNQTRIVDEDGDEYGATSGRLSCNNPNLQQISKRDPEMGAIVRSLFLPDEGQEWCCRDWSQMDFRIMAHYLDSPSINKKYDEDPNTDFHSLVASFTGLPRSATPGIKGDAKAINLGLCFGMGQGRMAQEMGLPYTEELRNDGSVWKKAGPEAEEIFATYHRNVPGVKAMLMEMTAVAKSRGFVRTGFGRRIRFPRGEKAYKAGAMIFQGTAADALKLKLIAVHGMLKDTGSRLIVNVHDEFDVSLTPGPAGRELSDAMGHVVETFDGVTCPLKLNVPIRSSVGYGTNWWEACK